MRRCSTPVSELDIPMEEVERQSRVIPSNCPCRPCTRDQNLYKRFLHHLIFPAKFGTPCGAIKDNGIHIPITKPLTLPMMAMLIGGDYQMTTKNLNYKKTFIIQ